MSKKVIIGIHGLGNKAPKETLLKWWKESLIEGLEREHYNTALPEFELVYWADLVYDKPLDPQETDKDSETYLRERYVKGNPEFEKNDHSTRRKVVDFLDQQLNRILLNEDYSLNYTAITDAIISRFFRDLDIYYKENSANGTGSVRKTKDLINQRLSDVILKYKGYSIMLIAHSMGSIIGYEVLKFGSLKTGIDYFITMGSPLGLPVVIGKIAAEQKLGSEEINGVTTPSCVKKHWYNFSDIMDKVAFNYKLADDFNKNRHGVIPVDFLIVNNYEYNGKRNPHKSYGYLRAPEFSKILNDFINEKFTLRQKIIQMISNIFSYISKIASGKAVGK